MSFFRPEFLPSWRAAALLSLPHDTDRPGSLLCYACLSEAWTGSESPHTWHNWGRILPEHRGVKCCKHVELRTAFMKIAGTVIVMIFR